MKRILSAVLLLAIATALRGQVTETPQTIEPGKFFLRMDAVTVGINRDKLEPAKYTAVGLASSILSVGVAETMDVQVGAQFFVRETFQRGGTRSHRSGWGDTSFRVKWAFWRDAKTEQSAAVIPFIKIPSQTTGIGNNHVEGGVIVPWSRQLGPSSEAGAMAEWDLLRNDANDGYDSRWFTSAFVRQRLVGGLGIYGEATLEISSASASSFAGGLGGGLTFDFSKNFQLDYGLSRGLGNRATDWVSVVRLRWWF